MWLADLIKASDDTVIIVENYIGDELFRVSRSADRTDVEKIDGRVNDLLVKSFRTVSVRDAEYFPNGAIIAKVYLGRLV